MKDTVVLGSNGQLGSAFRSEIDAVGLDVPDVDFLDIPRLISTLDEIRPRTLINCAAYTSVDAAESDADKADAINHMAVGALAEYCSANGIRFVSYSTDYVFDGTKTGPYLESDPVNPQNVYGKTKAAGESACLAANPDSLLVRTSWLISSTHPNFVKTMLGLGSKGTRLKVVNDQRGQATVASDLAAATIRALDQEFSGILHLSNPGPLTWFQLAKMAFELAGLDSTVLTPCTTEEFPRPAPRPANSVLGSERITHDHPVALPPIKDSLPRVVGGLIGH